MYVTIRRSGPEIEFQVGDIGTTVGFFALLFYSVCISWKDADQLTLEAEIGYQMITGTVIRKPLVSSALLSPVRLTNSKSIQTKDLHNNLTSHPISFIVIRYNIQCLSFSWSLIMFHT